VANHLTKVPTRRASVRSMNEHAGGKAIAIQRRRADADAVKQHRKDLRHLRSTGVLVKQRRHAIPKPFEDATLKDDRVIAINVRGVFYVRRRRAFEAHEERRCASSIGSAWASVFAAPGLCHTRALRTVTIFPQARGPRDRILGITVNTRAALVRSYNGLNPSRANVRSS